MAYVSHINAIFFHFIGKHCNKSCWVYVRRIGLSHNCHRLPVIIQNAYPLRIITACLAAHDFLVHNIFKNMLHIAHQRNMRPYIFTDFCRIHIHMYQYLVIRNQIRLADRPISHPRSYHDNQIRLIHGTVGTRLPVISYHAIIHRMPGRHSADAHHSRHYRNFIFFRKFSQFLFRIA